MPTRHRKAGIQLAKASRDKGSRGEHEVAELLADWWHAAEINTRFVRTPQSGGWHASAEFDAAGDLMVTPGSRFPWSVEVKRRESWSPARFVNGHASPVWSWWLQAIRDAKKIGRQPMLWTRRSHGNWIVLIPLDQVGIVNARVAADEVHAVYRYIWGAEILRRYDVDVVPCGFWAADILKTDPRIWLPA